MTNEMERTDPGKGIPMTFDGLFDNIALPLLLLNRDRQISRLNFAALQTLMLTLEDPIGHAFGNAIHCINATEDGRGCGYGPHCQKCALREAIVQCFVKRQALPLTEIKLSVYAKVNLPVDIFLRVTAIPIQNESNEYVLVCLQDISDQKMIEKKLLGQIAELMKKTAGGS